MANIGKITQVIGPVVDVSFEADYNNGKLAIQNTASKNVPIFKMN